jgi:uncharacterized protein YndB with AHSA1/START domain
VARRLVRAVLIALSLPFLLTGVGLAIGAFLPRDHVVSAAASYAVPPDSVWSVITDFPRVPQWRPEVVRMERGPDRDGHAVWLEVGSNGGVVPYEVTASDAPRLLSLRIADPDLPFGGTWDYALAPQREGTRLIVTERGSIKNPLFRTLARFAIGYRSTVDGYLVRLGKRLGEDVRPSPVEATPGR